MFASAPPLAGGLGRAQPLPLRSLHRVSCHNSDRDWGPKPKGTHCTKRSICDEVDGPLNMLRKSLHQEKSAVTGEASGLRLVCWVNVALKSLIRRRKVLSRTTTLLQKGRYPDNLSVQSPSRAHLEPIQSPSKAHPEPIQSPSRALQHSQVTNVCSDWWRLKIGMFYTQGSQRFSAA
jgi:hypothetical protein